MSTPQSRAPRRPPAERRSEISAAARAIALEEGLSAVTMRAVAARTSVTPALIAHYVMSMDALVATTFTAVIEEELDELAGLTASGSARSRLATLLRTLMDGTRDDVTLVWVDAWALGRRNESLAAAVRDAMDRWQGAVEAIITAGVAEGSFTVVDPAASAWQLLGMLDGVNAQSLVRWGGATDRSMLMERAAEGVLGMRAGSLGAEHRTPTRSSTS